MKEKILKVINEFKSSNPAAIEDKYMNGDCYVFARALVDKFGGAIVYLPIENHFVAAIDYEFYDIRGLIPSDTIYECYLWDEYWKIEPLDADRVEYYCIQGKEELKFQPFE